MNLRFITIILIQQIIKINYRIFCSLVQQKQKILELRSVSTAWIILCGCAQTTEDENFNRTARKKFFLLLIIIFSMPNEIKFAVNNDLANSCEHKIKPSY